MEKYSINAWFRSITLLLVILAMSHSAQAQQVDVKLDAPENTRSYGEQVFLSGDYAFISAYSTLHSVWSYRIIHIYERQSSGDWVLMDQLESPTGAEGDQFGISIALSGNRVLISAPNEELGGRNDGAAYIYEAQPGGGWEQVARLVPDDDRRVSWFGGNLSLDGDLAVLSGSVYDSARRQSSREVYVFERQENGMWEQVSIIRSESDPKSLIGNIALSGDKVLIANPSEDGIARLTGAVYLFERQQNGIWIQLEKFTASDAMTFDYFGSSIDLSDGRALISSERYNYTSPGAYVFEEQEDGSWRETAKLFPSIRSIASHNGRTLNVDLDGDMAILGYASDNYVTHDAGSVYLYQYGDDGVWEEVYHLVSPDSYLGYGFGNSVSLYGNYAIVGTREREPVTDQADGSAYVYQTVIGSVYMYDLTPIPGIVTGFSLINPGSEMPIPGFDPIPDGAVIDVSEYSSKVNVRANTTGAVRSVQFDLDGKSYFRVESKRPYALFGDTQGDYFTGVLSLGSHTVTATPYTSTRAEGTAGSSASVRFTLVGEEGKPHIKGFVAVDPQSNEDVGAVRDGDVFDLTKPPYRPNFRAEVPGLVSSVQFNINDSPYFMQQNVPPFAVYGDIFGDYAWPYYDGPQELKITAIPYSGLSGEGDRGNEYTITVHLIEGTAGNESNGDPFPEKEGVPETYELHAAYPNPFNPTTTVRFDVPESAHVRLVVYDMLGREVQRLVDGQLGAGTHEFGFDATGLPSGTYLMRLETPQGMLTKTALLIK